MLHLPLIDFRHGLFLSLPDVQKVACLNKINLTRNNAKKIYFFSLLLFVHGSININLEKNKEIQHDTYQRSPGMSGVISAGEFYVSVLRS